MFLEGNSSKISDKIDDGISPQAPFTILVAIDMVYGYEKRVELGPDK